MQAAKAFDVSKQTLFQKNISKTTWDIINTITVNNKQTQITINGNLVSDETISANGFNN